MGPTASGKTDLAVALAQRLPCEIISVDSAMVYRGLDIGTAKPSPEVLARAPHRLIDLLEPTEAYSTARFREDALAAMQDITAQGRIPLLVGGTMLYFRALQQGLAPLPSAYPDLRQTLAEEGARIGWEAMHQRLERLDPRSAHRIHPHDPQRIQRALEVALITGRPMSELIAEHAEHAGLPFRLLKLARAPAQRCVLHERIAQRFQGMIAAGLVEEVAALRARGDLHADLPSMRAVGYRQVWCYLDGVWSHTEMCERGIVASRQLAKRQLTWLRAERATHWIEDQQDPLAAACTLIEEAHAARSGE
ncbi:tRNA (adenosine(37)-N6)-dimethylallyltransferase MiaA [Thiocapsa imhoffii]|uniref:tRNA dimethylallyltransferase n=1 Tax=Thiocapsa imhoffii TaxID=382777 RepID=A0A9X0WJ95_9GAMM|nr:tRNA (adenosine(37)-N6)-dimethylallyltransferase MiaA [Thiocapsa imhoffii]MBK1645324.1 tRNA (adenosine(37)-N6)-dimethylallyltransferase MiaA [Thiocapsa imhoffii]